MSVQTVLDPTNDLVEQAKRVLPGGSFGNMPAEVVLKEGKGGRIWDEAGREYVDFLLGSGPMFVGHAHPEVTAAVQAQVPLGTTFFGNNRHGIALAEAICDAVPCADQVRFVCSGTEADLYAMRAVRAFRKRDKILKFEGGYHGMSDYALMSLAPKRPGNFPRADARFGRHPEVGGRRDAGRGLQRHRHGGKPDRGAEGRAGGRHRRAVPAPDPAQARLPAGAARRDQEARHSADLRRGRDRLPLRLWRGAGVLRRHARPLQPGQDRGRRLRAGRHRRPRRHHEALRSAGHDRRGFHLPGRHAVGQSGRRRGRPGDARHPEAARRLRAGLRDRPRADARRSTSF